MSSDQRDLQVDVLNRNRVLCSLRTVARLIELAEAEIGQAQKITIRDLDDAQLANAVLHAQNQLTLARLELPDLGAMEQRIEHARLCAFLHPAIVPAPEEDRGQQSAVRGQPQKERAA